MHTLTAAHTHARCICTPSHDEHIGTHIPKHMYACAGCMCVHMYILTFVSICIIVCAECECREGSNIAPACLAPYCQESTPAPTCPE